MNAAVFLLLFRARGTREIVALAGEVGLRPLLTGLVDARELLGGEARLIPLLDGTVGAQEAFSGGVGTKPLLE